jgi:hypothetical protein
LFTSLATLAPSVTGVFSSAADNPIVWDEPVKITAAARPKPNRRRTPVRVQRIAKGVEEAPLLTLKYRVVERSESGSSESVDSAGQFDVGDQLKLAVTTNQDGFLYIVHSSVGLDGRVVDQPRMLFPDPRIKDGRNEVTRDREYVVPADCREFDDPEDCWWEVTPPAGRELFTVIFSRDQITTLPKPGELVDQKMVDALETTSKQTLRRDRKISTVSRRTLEDGVFVQNTNKRDNEEIVEKIEIKHLTEAPDEPAVRTRAMFIKNRSDGLRVTLLKNGVAADPAQVFSADDELKVRLRSNFKGYVYFINVTPGAKRCVIFPCSASMSNEINAGQLTILPRDPHVIGFDEEKGTEVFQVVVAHERVDFLETAMRNRDCCDESNACSCQLSGSAATAAAELAAASKQERGGISADNLIAILPRQEQGGLRSRGIILAAGKDREKAETYVAIQDKDGGKLKQGQSVVFEIRLKHN